MVGHLYFKRNIPFCNIKDIFPTIFSHSISHVHKPNNNFETPNTINKKESTKKALLDDAKILVEEGKEGKAVALLKKYIKTLKQTIDPHSLNELSDAYSLLAVAYATERKIDLAIEALENKIALNPKNHVGYLEKANLHFSVGDLASSVNSLARASELSPKNPEPYYRMASQLYIIKNYDLALRNALIGFKLDNQHYENIVLIAMLMKLKGEPEFSTYFDLAFELQPKNHYHYCKIARIEYEMGNYESATEYIEKAFELGPNSVEPIYLASIVLLDGGDIESGKKLLHKALSINPNHIDSLIEISKVYIHENEYEELNKVSEKIMTLSPQNPVGYYFKASYLYHISVKDEAIENLKKCIILDPNYLMPYCLLSNILRSEERYREALLVCEKGLERNPEHVNLISEKGCVLMAEKKFDEALEFFEKSFKVEDENTDHIDDEN